MIKTYLRALYESFYNPRLYREAIISWPGFGGRYLAILAILLSLGMTVNILYGLHVFEKNELDHLIGQVPDITVTNGKFGLEGNKPVIISNRDKTINITIDPSKSESEMREMKTQVGIGNDFILFQKNNDYQIMDMQSLQQKDFKIDKQSLRNLWDQNAPFAKILSPFLLWLGQLVDVIIECFVVAILSYLVTSFMREEYDFLTRMRFAALALTPPEIISTVLNISIGHISAPWFILLLACLYIYVMIILMRRDNPKVQA